MKNKELNTSNREGTSQSERFPEALSPDYVKIDERSIIDLVRQSAEYARYVRYYNNSNTEDGNWNDFFVEIYDYNTKQVKFSSIEALESKASTSPHLALFLAFLRLFGIAQDNLNTLKESHLDFYYKEILQIKPRPAISDSVPLFFELNKAAKHAFVPANTMFDAGKDKNGKPLYYASKNDLIVNKAKIETVKGIYKDGNTLYAIDDILSDKDNNTETFLGTIYDEPAQCGFAITSPLFYLKDGKRVITLTAENITLSSNFRVEYSSQEGWVEATLNSNVITIEEQQPPLTAYEESVHKAGFNVNHPVIRLLIKDESYNLSSFTISNIKVSVTGSKDFMVKNDYGVLNHEQAFLPFGPRPTKSSKLYIYNANINSQNSVKVNIEWKGLPDDLKTYYKTYEDGLTLMFPNEAERKKYFDCDQYSITVRSQAPRGGGKVIWSYIKKEISSCTSQNGYAEINLELDLGHSLYQNIYAAVAINNAKYTTVKKFPNQPYTPEINNITIGYTLSQIDHKLIRIHPFGQVELEKSEPLIHNTDNEGELYIGISNIDKPSILTFYVHLSDHGNNPDKTTGDCHPLWHYLDGNEWVAFDKSKIIGDSTNHFTKSGIVSLSLPSGALTPHTLLPDNNVWLKLVFKENSDAFPSLENILTNVVDTIFVNQDNDLLHLEKGLPANTISKSVNTIQGIKSVTQPYPSYGGRAIENEKAFYTRVSERLRHKNRAWNVWDYERLILENFPAVFKVKCIPHASPDSDYLPGNVLIVLLPDCNIIPQKDIYKPRVSQALITDVEKFISAHCSPFVKIHVNNVEYEEIMVRCTVAFTKECNDSAYYSGLLEEELKAFLAPWTKEDPSQINFYKTLTKSQILYFIEKLPYIDYVTEMKVMRPQTQNRTNQRSQTNTLLRTAKQSLKSRRTPRQVPENKPYLEIDDEIIYASKQNAILTTFNNHSITNETSM